MIIDTHCHLTFPEFDTDRADVIGNAKKSTVKFFIVPGVDLLSSQHAVALAASHDSHIRAAIGFHPYEAQENPHVSSLEPLINEYVVAFGECGLDYHLYKNEIALSKKTNQTRIFSEHIELSLTYKLPLIMHCREAFEDLFNTLDTFSTYQPKGVIHCFSGGLEDMRQATKRGLYMGFDGNITFSKHLQSILPSVPLELLLFETDSPYLTPIPHRGKRNEPKYIVDSIHFASNLLNIPVEKLIQITTDNASRLFNFPYSS